MIKLRGAYYFGVEGKCNFFVAEGIVEAFGIGSMPPDSTCREDWCRPVQGSVLPSLDLPGASLPGFHRPSIRDWSLLISVTLLQGKPRPQTIPFSASYGRFAYS
jgi:hypothetical protein